MTPTTLSSGKFDLMPRTGSCGGSSSSRSRCPPDWIIRN